MIIHKHLIAKMQGYGIRGSRLEWFRPFLSNRRLSVKCRVAISESFYTSSGVPQKSHLGPFLFSLFIMDITDVVDTKCLLFVIML